MVAETPWTLPAVLNYYASQPERYRLDDDVLGGDIATKDGYYLSLPEETRKLATFALLRYDKRRLADGRQLLGPWPPDYVKLPPRDKSLWLSSAVDDPQFADTDLESELAFRRNILGEIVDDGDAIHALSDSITEINGIWPLFRRVVNPDLTYPFVNNAKDYSGSHREMYKLIGPDNMQVREIRRLLTQLGVAIGDTAKPRALFRDLARHVTDGSATQLVDALDYNEKARNPAAHAIKDWQISDTDHIEKFRDDCTLTAVVLAGLAVSLRRALDEESDN